MKSESSEIVVKESEQVEIRLTNSVPLSCPTSLNDSMKQGSCKLPVNIWTTAEKYRERCRNGLLMEDLLIDSLQCAVTFEFNESGNSSIVFNVTGYTDGMINYQNRTSRIHFNVSNYHYDRHGIWRNISIPEIKVCRFQLYFDNKRYIFPTFFFVRNNVQKILLIEGDSSGQGLSGGLEAVYVIQRPPHDNV